MNETLLASLQITKHCIQIGMFESAKKNFSSLVRITDMNSDDYYALESAIERNDFTESNIIIENIIYNSSEIDLNNAFVPKENKPNESFNKVIRNFGENDISNSDYTNNEYYNDDLDLDQQSPEFWDNL